MGENVLITGGAGYIGTMLAQRLVEDGHHVTLFDNLSNGGNPLRRLNFMLDESAPVTSALLLDDIPSRPTDSAHYRFIEGDVTDREPIMEVIANGNFSYVFHFADMAGIALCEADPGKTFRNNVDGTKNVIDGILSVESPPNLIYHSSSSVYHKNEDGSVFTEESDLPCLDDLDSYCRTKVHNEQQIVHYSEGGSRFPYLILRPATVGGLSARMRIDLLPNQFAYSAAGLGRIILANEGDYRAVVDLADLVDFHAAVVSGDIWHTGILNFGHLNDSKKNFAARIVQLAGLDDSALVYRPGVGDARSLRISSDLLHDTTGFQAQHGLDDMLGPPIELLKLHKGVFSSESEDFELVDSEFLNGFPHEFRKQL